MLHLTGRIKTVKVLQLWKSDSAQLGGGGAVAMYRLHSGLRKAGIDSKILCERKTTDSPHVRVLQHKPRLEIVEKIIKQGTSRLGLNDIHRLSSFDIKQHEVYVDADILHFHGLHGGFINYLALPSLTESKPTVFSLCDMWPMTGHCAFSYDCDRWKIGCGKCPYPDAHPAIKRDATHLEWKLKDWVYNRSNLTIVSKSKWLTKQAQQSMLSRYPIYEISNGIDTEIYQALAKEQCRLKLEIPLNKKVIMFAAVELNNFRKGGDLLLKALQSLPASLKAETVLLTLGKGGEEIAEAVEMQTLNLGYVSDDRCKVIAYSAADLFLFPTRAETFGNVALESIACGTPVVSFKVGGVSDHVRPGISGYLAEPENFKDFCDGIVQLLEDQNLRADMSQQGRAIALQEYSLELCTQRHIELYRQLLQN
jgi:glycosyltransferase involved in cell wall biosynthesis